MLEITSVGATVKYAWESTSGSRPTTGYTELPNVNEAPEFSLDVDAIECCDITDTKTRYTKGRQDPGSDATFTLNHTDAIISAWAGLVATASTSYASGKRLWWEYKYPGASNSYFWCGEPMPLGNSGIAQNELDTIPAHCVVNDGGGWFPAST